jgi:ring-1,2-phenylacetyl-CoA epoxidase subunit PaaC
MKKCGMRIADCGTISDLTLRDPHSAFRISLFDYLLRLGDSCLILSQRLGEWCGRGPALEEDLALTNVALDLNGQAQLWLEYASQIEGKGRTEDQLAFLRDAHEFRNLLLVEQANGDFAVTITRQFYFDLWHSLLLQELLHSSDQRICGISEKALKEVQYHLRRSAGWVARLGDGTEESHTRMQRAADELWQFTGELFEIDAVDEAMVQEKIGPDPRTLQSPWMDRVRSTFTEATLAWPDAGWMQRGGKCGIHTERLGYLLAEMQFLQRAYPGAQW